MKSSRLTFLVFVLCFISTADAQNVNGKGSEPLSFEASYVGDNVNNLSGGIKTGSRYLGMANLQLNFDTEKAGLWKGGQFYVNAANTHGGSPSFELLGDIQVASNIDAGNHTYIQEFWVQQNWGDFELTIGLQDLNVEFANSDLGALYLNSSFGILPVISGNITPPIFPLTALGITAKWNVSEEIAWVNALYDGSPTDFDYNPYNIKWEFVSGDGLLAVSELQYRAMFRDEPGIYKIGGYAHSHVIEESMNTTIPDSLSGNIFGFYLYADQTIWHQNQHQLSMFSQLGYSPSNTSTNDFYLGIGINYRGLFSNEGRDVLGLALAMEYFKNGLKSEAVIELTYHNQLTKNIFFQPDFQYIIHPAGTGMTLDNAFAGILRFGFNF